MGSMFNLGYDSIFYDGIFLTIVGQSTFVAAYAMLIFISRLQRFDYVQEEAALDLGATHVQTFRKILLPFLKPAIGSAAILGFLASFENYNTTVFTIVSESTLTTVLASKVRYGITPSISALAVIIICITLFGAIMFEILKRREDKYDREVQKLLDSGSDDRAKRANLIANPMLIITILIFMAGFGTIYFSGTIGVEECKVAVKELKKIETDRKIREFKSKKMFQNAPQPSGDTESLEMTPEMAPATQKQEGGNYGSIFAPTNLEGQAESDGKEKQPGQSEGYNSIFAPTNLEGQVDSDKKSE
jgi:spermidine/putrescine transport system permease protein